MHVARRAYAHRVNWWTEPWWAGVQGICSVLGLIAILIAVADFLVRINDAPFRAMSFGVTRVGERMRDQRAPDVEVTVTARPMGEHVLYEPRWVVWDNGMYDAPELPPVLDVRSDPVSITLHVKHEDLDTVKVGLAWVVPRRFGSFAAASRTTVSPGGIYERWEVYRWRLWPRKTVGRWVRGRDVSKRNPLNGPA